MEGHDLDSELVAVLLDGILGVIGTVKVNALAVLSRTGVVTADDEMGRAVVLADDSVPDGFARATHTHGERQETEDSHAVGVARQQGLVDAHTGEVVDVTGLGETHDGVDQDVGMVRSSSPNSEFSMGAVHGIAGLEGDDTGPAQLVEVSANLGGGVCLAKSGFWFQ